MRLIGRVAVAAMLACGATGVWAKNWNVMVGGYQTSSGGYYGGNTTDPVLAFSPTPLQINVGDTVTFLNQPQDGLQVAHNVVASDNSFRCANGCDGDGQGGNGSPAFNQWSATVTFTHAGTVNYHCEHHENMGMAGSIVVNAVATNQNIVGGMSGNWFNPTANQGGHGFQLEISPNNSMLAIWFVFNPAGTTQNWVYSQGNYDPNSNTVTLPAFLEQGGAFPPNFDGTKITAPAWGTLTFTFTDCSNGTAAWHSNATSAAAGYNDVTFPIQRLTTISGTACP